MYVAPRQKSVLVLVHQDAEPRPGGLGDSQLGKPSAEDVFASAEVFLKAVGVERINDMVWDIGGQEYVEASSTVNGNSPQPIMITPMRDLSLPAGRPNLIAVIAVVSDMVAYKSEDMRRTLLDIFETKDREGMLATPGFARAISVRGTEIKLWKYSAGSLEEVWKSGG